MQKKLMTHLLKKKFKQNFSNCFSLYVRPLMSNFRDRLVHGLLYHLDLILIPRNDPQTVFQMRSFYLEVKNIHLKKSSLLGIREECSQDINFHLEPKYLLCCHMILCAQLLNNTILGPWCTLRQKLVKFYLPLAQCDWDQISTLSLCELLFQPKLPRDETSL